MSGILISVMPGRSGLFNMSYCKSCNAPIYWGKTAAGKPCPFDDPELTQSHFKSCPNAASHSKKSSPAPAPPKIPQQPPDAFPVMGATGTFAVAEKKTGYLVGRWKDKKKGRGKNKVTYTEFTRYFIAYGGQCDCKQAEFGNVCSHQKAVQVYQDKQKHLKQMAEAKAKEEAERLKRNRFRVQYFCPEPQVFGIDFPSLEAARHRMEILVFTRVASRAVVIDRLEGDREVDSFPKEAV